MPNRNPLSVRMRVGFRVLSPIQKNVGEIFLYNSDVPGFKNNITILKLKL